MSKLEIRTNNVPRDIIDWWELTKEERAELDWIEFMNENQTNEFFRYKGHAYALSEFMQCRKTCGLQEWDGYLSDTYFSGTLVRYCNHGEQVIVGQYFS
jgi:hypothetical protein